MTSSASQRIRALLQPPDDAASAAKALQDIDATYTSWDEFEHLDTLDEAVQHAEQDNARLNQDLEASTIETQALVAQTMTMTQEMVENARGLAFFRHSLADDLTALSDELISAFDHGLGKATLLEDLESMQRSLKELENVRSYVQVIEQALKLSEAAVKQVKTSDTSSVSQASVTHYKALQDFVALVIGKCSTVDMATADKDAPRLRLVTFLEEVRDRTWSDIKSVLFTTILEAAEKLKWPMPVDYYAASQHDRQDFTSAFLNLLKLQDVGEAIHPPETDEKKKKLDGLYPLQALAQPLSLRFRYHFEGKRPTNRLDKPEWYFTHIMNASHEHRAFMQTHVQHLLSTTRYRTINAHREFSRLLFPILARKMRRSLPSLIPNPPMLAHTIYQALAFDASIRDEGFTLVGTSEGRDPRSTPEWEGIADVILGKKEAFDAWLDGETAFAEDQYNDIINSPDAWMIADEVHDEEATLDLRPTNSARRVKALIEQVTDRYQPLPRFSHKAKFLMKIQVPILEQYHSRISSSLDAFDTLSSSFVRAVPGALAGQIGQGTLDPKDLTSGVNGVQRLLKAWVSMRWISIAMDTWGEQLFFLELWAEINQRSSLRKKAQDNPSLPNPNPKLHPDTAEVAEDTLFQELLHQYATLTVRAEDMILRHICGEVEADLKVYLSTPWDHEADADSISIPRALVPPITTLTSQLAFLSRSLPSSSVTILYRRIASQIAFRLLQRVVFHHSRGKLSALHTQVFREECRLWVESCKTALGPNAGKKVGVPWARLVDAATMLMAGTEEVQRIVFTGEEKLFEKLVDDLGIKELSREELRHVLRARMDCWQ